MGRSISALIPAIGDVLASISGSISALIPAIADVLAGISALIPSYANTRYMSRVLAVSMGAPTWRSLSLWAHTHTLTRACEAHLRLGSVRPERPPRPARARRATLVNGEVLEAQRASGARAQPHVGRRHVPSLSTARIHTRPLDLHTKHASVGRRVHSDTQRRAPRHS